jgi:hypothetical protein
MSMGENPYREMGESPTGGEFFDIRLNSNRGGGPLFFPARGVDDPYLDGIFYHG